MSELAVLENDADLLPVLRKATNEDLDPLVRYITNDFDGRMARLTAELDVTEVYKTHHPNHRKYVDEIASEIQHFAGNTMANVWRGHGVL